MIEISVRNSGGVARVSLAGELDLAAAPDVEGRLQQVAEARPGALVLDLRELRFLDSTGLRVVLAADSAARRDGYAFFVVRGRESVQRVFRLTLLDRRLTFVDDPSEVER